MRGGIVVWATRALFGGTVLLVLGGCVQTEAALGAQCDLNTECQAPYVCRLLRCRAECATARDCPVGSLCVTDNQGVGACRLPDEATCARESDCPGALSCLGGACTNSCAEDRDCPAGATCSAEASGCVDVAETPCVRNADCARAADMSCALDRRCREECRADRDCREGAFCRDDGFCEPVAPPMDGSAGDGAVDADAGDASDGGTPDGSPMDGGDGGDGGGMDAGVDGGADGGADGGVDSGTPTTGGSCSSPSGCFVPRHATVDCIAGLCTITGCRDGKIDCDADYNTGCEVNAGTDVRHCGGCGMACGANEVCVGSCQTGSVAELDLGHSMSCARFTTGHVACWGDNRRAQLGIGLDPFSRDNGNRLVPALVNGVSTAVDLTVSAHRGSVAGTRFPVSHACVALSDGTVRCWGWSPYGQAGTIAAGGSGVTTPVAVAGITDAVEVASGIEFSCARRSGGEVVCWGRQAEGRLGNGLEVDANVTSPVSVSGITSAVSLHSTSAAFLCAGIGSSAYECWGNGRTAMGAGSRTATAPTPIAATALSGLSMSGIAAGTGVSYGIDGTGAMACWTGNSGLGLCGPDDFVEVATPYAYPGFSGVAEVAPGWSAVTARLATGELYCAGQNSRGECGLGIADSPINPPRVVPGITDATNVAAGQGHTCITRASGGVWCTGLNDRGQLGNGAFIGTSVDYQRVVGLP